MGAVGAAARAPAGIEPERGHGNMKPVPVIFAAVLICLPAQAQIELSTPFTELEDQLESGAETCNLRFSSNFVTDSYGMYDTATAAEDCLAKCRDYAASSVDSMADSDVVTTLQWTCEFGGQDIHNRVLK